MTTADQYRSMGRMPKTHDPGEMDERKRRAWERKTFIISAQDWRKGLEWAHMDDAGANRRAAWKALRNGLKAPNWRKDARDHVGYSREMRLEREKRALFGKYRRARERRAAA